jgi:hypothetical protein
MTNSLPALASGHVVAHSTIPSPLTILLAVAAVGYMLWSRMKGQPLQAKKLLVMPAILMVLGVTDLTGSSAPHLTAKDIAFLVASAGISAVLGAARGATIELYPSQGELWQRYRPVTAGLWLALIVAKLILMLIAGAAGASAGGGTSTLLLSLGISMLCEAAIVGPRALSTGVPFAASKKNSGGGRSGGTGSRSWDSGRLPAAAPPQQRLAGSGMGDGVYEPAPRSIQGDHHHHDHHDHHDGLTGPS